MKTDDLLNEASTALADIAEALAEGLDNQADVADAINAVAKALQDREPADFKAIVEAIRSMKIEAPQVIVNVEPTPVQVNLPELAPVFEIPLRQSSGWDVKITTNEYGAATRLIIKPLKD